MRDELFQGRPLKVPDRFARFWNKAGINKREAIKEHKLMPAGARHDNKIGAEL